jgi:hypothetical protein
MKRLIMVSFAASALLFGFTACNESGEGDTETTDSLSVSSTEMDASSGAGGTSAYIDLSTGATVRRDEVTGRYVDQNNNPVDFYVDINTRDTFYGSSGQVVNNAIIHEDDGTWRVDDTKIKIEGDEMKIKEGDNKTKIDGDEYKSKSGDTKVKSEGGETKVKTD